MQSWVIIHQCLQNGKSTIIKCSFWNGLLVDSLFYQSIFLNDQIVFYRKKKNQTSGWTPSCSSFCLFLSNLLTLGIRACPTPATSTWHSLTDRVNSLSGYCIWHQIKQAGNLTTGPIKCDTLNTWTSGWPAWGDGVRGGRLDSIDLKGFYMIRDPTHLLIALGHCRWAQAVGRR